MAGQGFGFADAASAVSGVSSLIRGLTTKRVKPYTPTKFTPSIRPAQADLESLQRSKNNIASESARMTNEIKKTAGSDGNASIRGLLGSQANVNRANQEAEAIASKQYMDDQNRVSQEVNQAEQFNTVTENQGKMLQNQQDNEFRNSRLMTANSGVQSALNYFTAREADQKNKEILARQSNQNVGLLKQATRAQLMTALAPYANTNEDLVRMVDNQLGEYDKLQVQVPEQKSIGSLLSGLFKKKPVQPLATN
jgi:hypothetical protein